MIEQIAKTIDSMLSHRFNHACNKAEGSLGDKCLHENPEHIGQYMLDDIEFRLSVYHLFRSISENLRPGITEEMYHHDLVVMREALRI